MFSRAAFHRWSLATALAAPVVTACVAPERQPARTSEAIEITDDAGTIVRLPRSARRVVSLIPSATETLIALGATPRIVGRTRYDVAPEVASTPSVGGTIDPSIESIVALRPDLVIAWASDQRLAVRDRLEALHIPVFVLRTEDTTDVFRAFATLGRLTAHDSAAVALATSVRASLDSVRRSTAGLVRPSVMFVVFPDPPMTAGPRTFIGQLLALAGGRSIFADTSALWPNVSMEEIVRRDPDLVIVPVGEFRENALDRLRKLPGWRELHAVRDGRVVPVPADLVNRPSPHIVAAAHILRNAIHPELAGR